MGRRHLIAALFGLSILVTPVARAQQPSHESAILDVVVWGIHAPIDPAAYTEPLRSEVSAYIRRAKAYRSTRFAPDASGEMKMVTAARVAYERRLVASTTDPRAPKLAVAYVDDLSPCYEWEGMSGCPAGEALFADEYINQHPGSPFIGYLPLLAAHRWLCAAEFLEFEKKTDEARSAQHRYNVRIAQALKAKSLVIRTAAQQLAARASCLPAR